jgi:antitoxin MazE
MARVSEGIGVFFFNRQSSDQEFRTANNKGLIARPYPPCFFGQQTDLTGFSCEAILGIYKGGANMVTRIQRWGNSQGLRLAKQVLEDACISVGDDVDVTARDGMIVIAPVRCVRGKQSLQELVSRIPRNYETKEIDWGEPVGKEVW